MTLTYIFHSGFVLETEKSILIFDYWLDLNGVVPPFLKSMSSPAISTKTTLIVSSSNGESSVRVSPISFPKTSISIAEPRRRMLTYGWPRVAHGLTALSPFGH